MGPISLIQLLRRRGLEYSPCGGDTAFDCGVHRPARSARIRGFAGEEDCVLDWFGERLSCSQAANFWIAVRAAGKRVVGPIVVVNVVDHCA